MFDFSVLISIYKGDAPHSLSKTLESVWYQQSLKPQKIVLVIDGPIGSLLDEGIKHHMREMGQIIDVLRLNMNVGLGAALNEGLKLVTTPYVARIDCDDIAEPDRFFWQVDFAKQHPEVSIFSGFMSVVDYQDNFLYTRKVPTSQAGIHLRAKFSSPIAHPVSFFKLKDILSVGGYPNFRRSQDMMLCAKLIQSGFKIDNMSYVLGTYKRPNLGLLKRLQLNFADIDTLRYMRKQHFIKPFHFYIICLVRFLKSFFNA